MAKVDNYVSYMEKIAKNDSHGYSQDHRMGNPDYDCSSLVSEALNKAGFNVSLGSTTRNLYSQLVKCGFKPVSKPFQRGDIHLSVGHHVAVSTDENHIVHASINEKGRTTNGKPGDQTGKEICIRTYYEHSKGWDYHLRYMGGNTSSKPAKADGKNDFPVSYTIGKAYTLQVRLQVRTNAGVNSKAKTHTQLTVDGRKHDSTNKGMLDAGTVITCKSIKIIGKDIWIKCPSGWIAAYYNGKIYIK